MIAQLIGTESPPGRAGHSRRCAGQPVGVGLRGIDAVAYIGERLKPVERRPCPRRNSSSRGRPLSSLDPPSLAFHGDSDTSLARSFPPKGPFTVTDLSVNRYIHDPRTGTPLSGSCPWASGHPDSPRYADQVRKWADLEYIPQLWDWPRIEARGRDGPDAQSGGSQVGAPSKDPSRTARGGKHPMVISTAAWRYILTSNEKLSQIGTGPEEHLRRPLMHLSILPAIFLGLMALGVPPTAAQTEFPFAAGTDHAGRRRAAGAGGRARARSAGRR